MVNKNFLQKMFADGETNTVSHKRVVSIISIVMLVVLSMLSCFGYSPTTEFIYIFGALTGGESVLTTVEKTTKTIKKISGNENEYDDAII